MADYTWNDVIYNPNEIDESYIGKTVFYGNLPVSLISMANENSDYVQGVLIKIDKESQYPFQVSTKDEYEKIRNYPCIIIKKEESYEERSKQWIRENNLKVGDYVKVTRTAVDYEDGWGYVWDYHMDLSVGKILRVKGLEAHNGFIALEDSFGYPYFVLEKVEEPKPKYVPFTSKEEFIEAFHYHDNANYSEIEDILMNYGMWIKSKDEGYFVQVWIITASGIQTEYSCCPESWEDILANYTFLDGTPCGKSKEN